MHTNVHIGKKTEIMYMTIARGYRLKASTHKLIKKMQTELNLSQEKVILKAIRLYYKSIIDSGKVNVKVKKINNNQ